jgi:serine/threonine protein kinase
MSWNDPDAQLADLLDSIRAEISRTGKCDTVSLSRSHPELANEALQILAFERELAMAVADWKGQDSTDTIDAEETGLLPLTNECDHKIPLMMDRYRIVRQLGRGGMGTVYAAEDPELRRQVALKLPHFSGPPDKIAATRARFLREARAAARVEHPNVCPIYDVGEFQEQPFVVMAFVEGETLADRLTRQQRFENPREAVELVAQVAEALAAVHDHGITHRDLKPANILIRKRDGQAVLTDFGLAQVDRDGEPLTNEGAMVGTPAYMAPEQADPGLGPVGPRSDIFSLGIVLFQMLTGRRPFEGTASQILGQLGSKPVPHVSMLRSELPATLDGLVAKATAQRQESRFASAAEFAAALRGWLTVPAVASPEETSPFLTGFKPVAKRRNWPFLIVLSTLMALAVFVPAGYLAVHVMRHGAGSSSGPNTAGQPNAVSPPAQAALPPLKGSIDLLVSGSAKPKNGWMRLNEPGAVPVRPHDIVRIEARLNRPAFVYIVWLDTDGKAQPTYPWVDGDWSKRPVAEKPLQQLNLPDEPNLGFPLESGPPGIESLLMLVREEPLPAGFDLQAIFANLPAQQAQDVRSLAWFENGDVVRNEQDRGPIKLGERIAVDDPVLRTQSLLRTKLKEIFPYTRAVCFGDKGDEK